jgi:predicted RNA-binding Zn-ribbon protein involved in translation (DUF1610 family)
MLDCMICGQDFSPWAHFLHRVCPHCNEMAMRAASVSATVRESSQDPTENTYVPSWAVPLDQKD